MDIDQIQTLADRLAEALHGAPTTISTPHGLVIIAAAPGAVAPALPPVVSEACPSVAPVVPPAAPAPQAEDEIINSSTLRDLARKAAQKIGADKVRSILGKSCAEMTLPEAVAATKALRKALEAAS